MALAQAKNYTALTLKGFKYITDLLININSTTPKSPTRFSSPSDKLSILQQKVAEIHSQLEQNNPPSARQYSYKNNYINEYPTTTSPQIINNYAKSPTNRYTTETSMRTDAYRPTTDTSKVYTGTLPTEESFSSPHQYSRYHVPNPEPRQVEVPSFKYSTENREVRVEPPLRARENPSYYSPTYKSTDNIRNISSPLTIERSTQYTPRDPRDLRDPRNNYIDPRENKSVIETRSNIPQPSKLNESISYFTPYTRNHQPQESISSPMKYPEISQFSSYQKAPEKSIVQSPQSKQSESVQNYPQTRLSQQQDSQRKLSNFATEAQAPSNKVSTRTSRDFRTEPRETEGHQQTDTHTSFYRESQGQPDPQLNVSQRKDSNYSVQQDPQIKVLEKWQEEDREKLKLHLERLSERSNQTSPSKEIGSASKSPSQYKQVLSKIANEGSQPAHSREYSRSMIEPQLSPREQDQPYSQAGKPSYKDDRPSPRELESYREQQIANQSTSQYMTLPDDPNPSRSRAQSTISRAEVEELLRRQSQQLPKSILKSETKYQAKAEPSEQQGDDRSRKNSEISQTARTLQGTSFIAI